MSVGKKYQPGSIREMVAVSLPMVVSFACDTVMIFTDRIFLSKLSPETMSAAMAGGLSVFVLMAFFIGLVGYGAALVAQYYGAKKNEACGRCLVQLLMIAVLSYPLIVSLVPLAHWIFDRSGIEAVQLYEQKKYFDVLIFGSMLTLSRHALSSFFTGIGQTRIVMNAAIAAMVINIGLNYVFVFGKFGVPALGVQGAALGTICATAAATGFLLVQFLSRSMNQMFLTRRVWKFDWILMRQLWRFGYPSGMEVLLNLLAFTAMVYLFHGQGPVAAAATTVVFNWDMVTYVPLLGIEIGVTSLVGRYIGAGQMPIVDQVVKSGIKMGLVYAGMMTACFVCMPQLLVNLFSPKDSHTIFIHAQPLAVSMVKLVALYVTAQALLMVFIGALRGASDTLWAMRISVGIHWVLLTVLYILLNVLDWSVYGSWVAVVIVFMVLSVLPYGRYRSGQWQKIRVVDDLGLKH